MSLRITYDPSAYAAYIQLVAVGVGGIKKTVEALPGQIYLYFDKHQKLVGIEILNADKLLPPEILKQAELPNLDELK